MNYISEKPIVILLGFRRSGTSILNQLIAKAIQGQMLFEPHDLWFVVSTVGIDRFRLHSSTWRYCFEYHHRMFTREKPPVGLKMAFNPGVEHLDFPKFRALFPNCRFVFVERNWQDTYASYKKADSKALRGICGEEEHKESWKRFYDQSWYWIERDKGNSFLVNYDRMIRSAGTSLQDLWKFLRVDFNAEDQIKTPANTSGV